MVKFEKPKTVDEALALIKQHLPSWEWLLRNGPKSKGSYLGNILSPGYPQDYRGYAVHFPCYGDTEVDALWNAFIQAHIFALSHGLTDDTRH